MSLTTTKLDILMKIIELEELGENDAAFRLQKVYIESLRNDKDARKFSPTIELNRKNKKLISDLELNLSIENVNQDN